MLNLLDEFVKECLAIRIARRLKAIDLIDMLSDPLSCEAYNISCDNGPEFVAEAVQESIRDIGAKAAYII